ANGAAVAIVISSAASLAVLAGSLVWPRRRRKTEPPPSPAPAPPPPRAERARVRRRLASAARQAPGDPWLALVAVGMVFVTMNGVRLLPGATVADFCFALATLIAVPVLLFRRPSFFRIPIWLLVSAGALAATVLVSTAGNVAASNLSAGLKFLIAL